MPVFDDLRNVNRGKNERKCNTNMPTESLKEFELSFVYGIESSSDDVYEYTDDMESLILNIVASTVLICASQSDAHISQRSKRLDGGIRDSGAVRIRYPEYGEITSICESFNIVLLLCLCNHICLISRTSSLELPCFPNSRLRPDYDVISSKELCGHEYQTAGNFYQCICIRSSSHRTTCSCQLP